MTRLDEHEQVCFPALKEQSEKNQPGFVPGCSSGWKKLSSAKKKKKKVLLLLH